jgi:alkylglycerol monooxygenase
VDLTLYAIPFFFALMGVEFAVARARGVRTLRTADALTNLALGTMQVLFTVVAAFVLSAFYAFAYAHRVWDLPQQAWWVWLLGFVGVDVMYYFFHRFSHRSMIGWVLHAPHHSSEDYNLSVALRQGPLQPLCSRVFYMVLGFAGIPPFVFVTMLSINTLYQFWVHTELIGRLGVLEHVLNTPSHHRVHHGCNAHYIDKNHAGILIIWDKMFGSFVAETTPPTYGTVVPLSTWNPLRASARPMAEMLQKIRASTTAREVAWSVFGPPEFLPSGMRHAPSVEGRVVYDDKPPPRSLVYAALQTAVTLALSVWLLLQAPSLPYATIAWGTAWLVLSFAVVGLWLDNARAAPWWDAVRVVALVGIVLAVR